MRIVIARMHHETNTFSPVPTLLLAFGTGNGTGPLYGERALAAARHERVAMGAFVHLAEEWGRKQEKKRGRMHGGVELATPLFAMAYPGAPVEASAYTHMCDAIVAEVEKGCDAIMLDLHGAMVAQNSDDGEGDLLERIRAIAPNVPMTVALDLHGNISRKIVDNADIVVGFKTYPHIDMYETGEHAGRLLFDMIEGKIKPVIGFAQARVLAQTLAMNTNAGAMKEALDGARHRENDPAILACSVFGGFPLADTSDAGMSVVVVADGDRALAERTAKWGADFLWSRRGEYVFRQQPLSKSMAQAGRAKLSPVILLDHGDNCMSGGTCDTTDVLKAALGAGFGNVLVGPTCDPEAVRAMVRAGVGARVSLKVGNKLPMPKIGVPNPAPIELTGTVRAISDGAYVVSGPIFRGSTLYMGVSAVLDFGAGQIVVTSSTHEPLDLGCFTSLGLDPLQFKYWILKSRMYFRPVFEPLAAAVIACASAGVTSSDNAIFRFEKVRRPIYPLR